jgi:hypothetical protein
MTKAAAVALGLGIAVAACGQVTQTSSSSPVQACTDLAQALCAKRASCTGGAGITRTNGDMSTCVTREELSCTIALDAPDIGNTPSTVEACVAAYATYSCADFLNGNPPAVCTPSGGRANGATCAFNDQCQTAFCARDQNTICGACAPAPSPGDSCASSACGHDQTCIDATQTCAQEGDLNSACGAGAPCGAGLSCVGSTATVAGSCQVAVGMAGKSCGGAGNAGCDGSLGLYCAGAAGAKTCMLMTYAADGAACGLMSDGTRVGCKAGTCFTSAGAAASDDTGVCKADAPDGAACDTMLGPRCAPPARCVLGGTGTAGICTVPDAKSCG